jgi:hypothetical protein
MLRKVVVALCVVACVGCGDNHSVHDEGNQIEELSSTLDNLNQAGNCYRLATTYGVDDPRYYQQCP